MFNNDSLWAWDLYRMMADEGGAQISYQQVI